MEINEELIKSQIDIVLSDVEEPVVKTVYSFKDEERAENQEFLSDESLDIKQALDISGLTLDQAKKIANQAYYSISSGSTGRALAEMEATSSSDENNNAALTKTASILETIGSWADTITGKATECVNFVTDQIAEFAATLDDYIPKGSAFTAVLSGILKTISDNMRDYQDGVSETSFGANMEESWEGKGNRSFLDYFSNVNKTTAKESRRINFLKSTPLDQGSAEDASSFYGSMILGVPYRFNEFADPTNRSLINTLIKDSKYLSLTPGMPKYNGTSYTQAAADNILMQTQDPNAMLSYLTRNGLDKYLSDKDKRYYTFKTDYAAYFSYLETMLNTIWIKLGLAETNGAFNLFTFFDIINNNENIDPTQSAMLKAQYNSSIGFYTNISGAVSESVDSQQTGFGGELAAEANGNSSSFQQINYISGMGTGGAAKNASRKIGNTLTSWNNLKDLLGSTFSGTISAVSSLVSKQYHGFGGLARLIAGIAKTALAPVNDITTFMNTKELGAVVQSFATANGMKVVYPELWMDSSYSKNINFNFSFVSPYGDPMSIFKYVFVPFCALACFAMPRQAAENGYVSPFFVRADVPGVVTSDLALISSFTWTRGGSSNLWTKDGLPRAIDCSITITDLYPYLSMTRRLSYLSANPSYSIFLDSLCGMLSLNDNNATDELDSYFIRVINRVNGLSASNSLWNRFNSSKSAEMKRISNEVRSSMTKGIDPHSIPWLHNSSI